MRRSVCLFTALNLIPVFVKKCLISEQRWGGGLGGNHGCCTGIQPMGGCKNWRLDCGEVKVEYE